MEAVSMTLEKIEITRTLIIDDDTMLCHMLASYLDNRKGISVTGVCENCQEATEILKSRSSDVAVLNTEVLRDNKVLQLTQLIKACSQVKFLLLTTIDEREFVDGVIKAGVRGILHHNHHPEVIVDAIRTIANGAYVLSSEAADKLSQIHSFHNIATTPLDDCIMKKLTKRDLQILSLLCVAATNSEISKHLNLSESTVKTYVSALMAKMNCTSRLKVVVTAFQLGFIPDNAVLE